MKRKGRDEERGKEMEEMEREEKEMKKEGRKDEDEVKRTARQDRAGNSRGRLEVTTREGEHTGPLEDYCFFWTAHLELII